MDNTKLEYDKDWQQLIEKLKLSFGKVPDINAILFLIGVQEIGKGMKEYSKEEKQDLMHVGLCTILCSSNYFQLMGVDNQGWPIFISLKPITKFNLIEQEYFIRTHIKEYFALL